MTSITFAKPFVLSVLLFLVPAAALFIWWATRRQEQALSLLGDSRLVRRLTASVHYRGRRWRAAFWLLALALLLLALARPQWGTETQEIEQEGLQVIVALDVSQSMLADDIKPTRLDRAKLEIEELIGRLNGDEIGLVLFSGASFVQVPLTTDYFTALNYLDSASPGVISRPGTVIGDAIRTAGQAFDENLSSQRVLIVMTDGEDRETDPLAAAQELAGDGVKIYTIGFGTPEGVPVPETDAAGAVVGYKTGPDGAVAISRLNQESLQAIAQAGNGRYYQATPAGDELDSLLAEIDDLQRAQLLTRTEVRHIERFQIFLALAIGALLLAEMMPDRVRSARRADPGSFAREPVLVFSRLKEQGIAALHSTMRMTRTRSQ